jgi:hypothetical protein
MVFEGFFENLPVTNECRLRAGVKLSLSGEDKCFSVGVIGTPKALGVLTDTTVPTSVSLTATTVPVNTTLGCIYFRTANLAAIAGQLATCMVRTTLAYNVFDAYGLQSHLAITANMATVDANAHLTAISGKVTITGGVTVAKGWVTAGLFIWEGAATITQMGHVVSIVNEAGSTGALSMLHINDDVGTVPYFSFAGADGTGKGIYTHTAAGTQHGTIKVLINGVAKWIPFMQAE